MRGTPAMPLDYVRPYIVRLPIRHNTDFVPKPEIRTMKHFN